MGKGKLACAFHFDLFTLLINCDAKINKKLNDSLIVYLRNLIQKNSKASEKTAVITYPKRNPYDELEQVGYWCFIKVLRKEDFKSLVGVSDVFDFYYQYERFDFTKFDVPWLLNLYPHTLKSIAKSKRVKEKIRSLIVHVLDERNVSEMDKSKLLQILTDYFC